MKIWDITLIKLLFVDELYKKSICQYELKVCKETDF